MDLRFLRSRERFGCSVQQKSSSGQTRRKILRLKLNGDYGVGDAVVVVVSVDVLVSVPGVAVSIGVIVAIGVSAGDVVTVVLVLVVVSVEVAGEAVGLTTVVLFSVSPGDAAGAAVSVFCSHAARSAALARMQISFFIGNG